LGAHLSSQEDGKLAMSEYELWWALLLGFLLGGVVVAVLLLAVGSP
jgi:hypothetical protein